MTRGGRFVVLLVIVLLLISSIFAQGLDAERGDEDSFDDAESADSGTSAVSSGGFTGTSAVAGDLGDSYNWLHDTLVNSTMPVDVRSLAMIALIQGGSSRNLAGLVEQLRLLEDQNQKCWPSTGCKVADSALATLALALAGQEVSQEVDWIRSARIAGLPPGGEWSIAIKSDSDGSCAFTFTGVAVEREFTLEGDIVRLPGGRATQQQYYIRLNELHPTLATASVLPEITVNCEVVNPIITLLYKPNLNTFFIQRSDAGASQIIKVANACYGNTRGAGPCNYETTAIATWALLEIGTAKGDQDLTLENLGTHIYLESQAINKRNDPNALGFLNRILIKAASAAPSFMNDLVNLQRISDGSWGNNIITTSVATFGLTGSDRGDAVTRGLDFIRGGMRDDGSWNNDLKTTAWALIALHGGELSRLSVFAPDEGIGLVDEICGNGVDDNNNGIFDCGEIRCASDPVCQCQNGVRDAGESGVDCGGTCAVACVAEEAECTIDTDCFSGEICVSGTCVSSAPVVEDEDEFVPVDDKEEEKSLWWLWLIILIVLILLIVLFYLKYVKTGKVNFGGLFRRGKKQPTFEQYRSQAEFRPVQKPTKPSFPYKVPTGQVSRPVSKTRGDAELEKSLEEAKKLLGGK